MTRRDWLACGGYAFLAACGPKKGTGYPGYALVACSGDNSVTAIDLTAFRFAKSLIFDAPPSAVIAGASGIAYVLTPSNGTVSIVDNELNRTIRRKWAGDLAELRLTSDGKRLIAISANAKELIEADAATLNVLHRGKLRDRPSRVELSPTGQIAVVGGEAGSVELFSIGGSKLARAELNGRVGSVRFRADGKLLLAAKTRDRSLTVINVPALQMVADLPLAMQPENLCFTADGGPLFVSGEGMDAVAIVFPYNALEVEQTVLAGRDPGVMACSSDPAYLFVASHSGSDVSILNIDSRKVIGLVEVGQNPAFIAITPDGQYALVLDRGSGDVAIIHIGAIRANRQRSGAALFTVLPVGDKPVHCAIVPRRL